MGDYSVDSTLTWYLTNGSFFLLFYYPNNIANILFRKIKFMLILRNEPTRDIYNSDAFDLAFRMLCSCDNDFGICVFD